MVYMGFNRFCWGTETLCAFASGPLVLIGGGRSIERCTCDMVERRDENAIRKLSIFPNDMKHALSQKAQIFCQAVISLWV